MQLNRRGFLFRSAAIIAASNLMPGHSIAHILEFGPRSIILDNLARIAREHMAGAVGRPVNRTVINTAFDQILAAGVNNNLVTTGAVLQKHWRNDPRTVPDAELPVAVAKRILGTYKMPVDTRELVHWQQFVKKYAEPINECARRHDNMVQPYV